MWDAIASNRRRSFWLLLLIAMLLVAMGGAIGGIFDPLAGTALGMMAAIVTFFILWIVAALGGRAILLHSAHAREIKKEDAPLLYDVVEEMMIASGLGTMPAIYIIDDAQPNAFAVGARPKVAAVAVTTGLLKRLTRDELQGVIGHEIGHVKNYDIRFMTLAAILVGTIAVVGEGFVNGLGNGGGRGSDNDNGAAFIVLLLLGVVLAIFAPIAARMLYMACSRRREYLADASSARFTRYPEGLASALEKIGGRDAELSGDSGLGGGISSLKDNASLAPLYIVNPRQALNATGLFATHPPLEERVRILRAMGKSAGFDAYNAAYAAIHGAGSKVIGGRTLADDPQLVGLREASPEEAPQEDATARAREALGVLDRAAGMLVIPCACGLTIKVPPKWNKEEVVCPRCQAVHNVAEGRSGAAAINV